MALLKVICWAVIFIMVGPRKVFARILFVLFSIAKDPMFLCSFDCTTETGNALSFGIVSLFSM